MLAKLSRALDIALPFLCYGLLAVSLFLLVTGIANLLR